jgi:hypothetical protein
VKLNEFAAPIKKPADFSSCTPTELGAANIAESMGEHIHEVGGIAYYLQRLSKFRIYLKNIQVL